MNQIPVKNEDISKISAKFWPFDEVPFAAQVSGSASFDCQQMQNYQLENLTASTDFLLLRWRVGTDNAGRLQPRYILAK